jgi:AcrR family transcriptional regulator
MQVEEKVIPAFRNLVSSKGYEKAPISEICAAAGVSRKTFYAHYLDKHDLLEHVFYQDIIQPLNELRKILPTDRIKSAPQLLTETIYRTILDNRQFYHNLFSYVGDDGSATRDLATVLLTKQITMMNLSVLHLEGYPVQEREFRAYFFAAAHVALISKWVRDNMVLPPEKAAQIFVRCTLLAFNRINEPIKNW